MRRVLIVAITQLLLQACTTAPAGSEGAVQPTAILRVELETSGSETDSLRVWVEVPETVPAGSLVPLTLYVQNISERELHLLFPGVSGKPVGADFMVAHEDGQEVWSDLHCQPIPLAGNIVPLQPGERLRFTSSWNQRADDRQPISRCSRGTIGPLLAPGRYKAYGIVSPAGSNQRTEPQSFTIVPRE